MRRRGRRFGARRYTEQKKAPSVPGLSRVDHERNPGIKVPQTLRYYLSHARRRIAISLWQRCAPPRHGTRTGTHLRRVGRQAQMTQSEMLSYGPDKARIAIAARTGEGLFLPTGRGLVMNAQSVSVHHD